MRNTLAVVGCVFMCGLCITARSTPLSQIQAQTMTSTQTATASIKCSQGTLDLSSDGTQGILVTESSPVSSWNVETGDVIQSAGGVAVRTPEDLFSIIRDTSSKTLELSLQRRDSQTYIYISVPTYKACIPPPPPPPPPPPSIL